MKHFNNAKKSIRCKRVFLVKELVISCSTHCNYFVEEIFAIRHKHVMLWKKKEIQ